MIINQEFEILYNFGLKVKSRRKALGLSQKELADRMGMHRSYLSAIERGERNLSLVGILNVAHKLELSISEFIKDL